MLASFRFSRGIDLARAVVCASIVLGLGVFAFGVFAAQPPDPAPGPQAGPPTDPAPPPKAAQADGAAKKPSYIVYPVDENLKGDRGKVQGMRRAGRFAPGEQEVFDKYYQEYALARWSVEENAAAVAGWRRELGNDLRNPKTGAVRDHLNTLALAFMGKMATECYPVARFNAMLMIGELNAVEPVGFGESAVPLPQALPVLVQAVQDPKQHDDVKVAALIGILRHLQLGAVKSPDDRTTIGAAALAVVGSQRPPSRSTDGHSWMRKRAADVLAELGVAGDNGEVATALAAMVADPAVPFYARCSAAEALGRLDYTGAVGLDALKLALPLGRLAVDACTAEAKAQAEAEKKAEADLKAQGGPGGFPPPGVFTPPGGFPGRSGEFGDQPGAKPAKETPVVFRNRLKARVHAASVGLGGTEEKPGGVASLAGGGTRDAQFVATVQKHVQAILKLIENTRAVDEKKVTPEEQDKLKAMMADIKPLAEQLRAALSKAGASPAPAPATPKAAASTAPAPNP